MLCPRPLCASVHHHHRGNLAKRLACWHHVNIQKLSLPLKRAPSQVQRVLPRSVPKILWRPVLVSPPARCVSTARSKKATSRTERLITEDSLLLLPPGAAWVQRAPPSPSLYPPPRLYDNAVLHYLYKCSRPARWPRRACPGFCVTRDHEVLHLGRLHVAPARASSGVERRRAMQRPSCLGLDDLLLRANEEAGLEGVSRTSLR